MNKMILLAGALSCFSFMTLPQTAEPAAARDLYTTHCARCHGNDGTKGKWGAKNLQTSRLNDTDILFTITKGRKIMPAWEKTLTSTQIESLKDYVKTLRQTP